ncbi:MAG: hypothetical protein M3365_08990 [Gemmatimonadota bacterium]|nr:hypothetical protein [Gemmatimonadota bacterium]
MSHLSEDRFDQLVSEERARDTAPLNSWEGIARRAREEGLIRERRPERWTRSPWMRAAAAVVLLSGGIAIGRWTPASPAESTAGQTAPSVPSAGTAAPAGFNSVEEAWAILDRASADYQLASAFLAARNSPTPGVTDSVSMYRARLAALEQLMNATVTARENAPRDPVINQYYLAALGAREATAQQLGAVRPANLRLKGF